MKIKNILVPIDFSKCSKNALKVAIGLAKRFDAKIHMVNAVHIHTPHPDLVGGTLIESITKDYENQVKESFEELEKEIIELKDVPHEADRFISYLTDAINSEAESKNIDLIVMGTRSNHDKLEHLIGTRASDIIDSSPIPVIVIPEGTKNFQPKRIGFASDLSEIGNIKKMEIINKLATEFKSEIMVFTVMDDPDKLTVKDQNLIADLSKKFGDNKCSARTVKSDSIGHAIVEFTESHKLDMLAMIHRKHSFFERLFKKSMTKNIVIDINIPLLSFHE